MRAIALMLAWLACTGHGRRVQTSSKFTPAAAFSVAGPGRIASMNSVSASRSHVRMQNRARGDEMPLHNEALLGRRQAFGRGIAAAAAITGIISGRPIRAIAENEPSVKLYFGAGCFWHVQHEFVNEEVSVLGRNAETVTAVSGFAGGSKAGLTNDGKNAVCYHNPFDTADYGELGHTEVVQLEIPQSQIPQFTQKYFALFGERGIRHDPMDRGGEYRSAIGLPGGEKSPHFSIIKQAALNSPGKMKLVTGKGNEKDTIFDKAVLVYDSDKFPFYPAEVYHQFHNDFMGPAYGRAYNEMQKAARNSGRIQATGCPEMQGWY